MEAPPLLPVSFTKSDPGAATVHSDGVMGSTRSFNPGPKTGLAKPKCDKCGRRHVRGVPCFAKFFRADEPRDEQGRWSDILGEASAAVGHQLHAEHRTASDTHLQRDGEGNVVSSHEEVAPGQHEVIVHDERGHYYGHLRWDDSIGVDMVVTRESKRHKGIATAMWKIAKDVAKHHRGVPEPRHSHFQTPAGKEWAGAVGKAAGTFDETKHPRGQPQNAGEFASEPGGGSANVEPSKELSSPDEIPALMSQLASLPKDAPVYNLMDLKVAGKPMFANGELDIPRKDMPQLGGKPTPGTPSAKLPINARGNVDLSEGFMGYLKDHGIKVEEGSTRASQLKPTQNQLNGRTVGYLYGERKKDDFSDRPTWISKDGFVIDGTHRWAARLADGDAEMAYRRVDLPIRDALKVAQQYADEMGVESESASQSNTDPVTFEDAAMHDASLSGGFSLHPKTGEPPDVGFMVAIQGHNVEVPNVTDINDPTQRSAIKAAIVQYVKDNAELWKANPQAYVGGWWDKANGEFTLDPSENIMDQAQATTLGQQRNQQEIWDVVNGTGIDTGGTGDRADAAPRLLKAAGGWLRRRTGSVGGSISRSAGGRHGHGRTATHPGIPGASATDPGPVNHPPSPQFLFAKHDVTGESRDFHGRWTAGASGGPGGGGTAQGDGGQRADGGLGDSDGVDATTRPLSRNARIKRDDAKDNKMSKDMRGLIKRDGVEYGGDLQPGDVVQDNRMSGEAPYMTIEHVDRGWQSEHMAFEPFPEDLRSERTSLSYIGRRPSGRMVMGSTPASAKLGGRLGWRYIGSHKVQQRDTDQFDMRRPAFQDQKVDITRPLLDSQYEEEVARGVQLVANRCPPHALDGLHISADSNAGSNNYAEYRGASGGKNIVVNSRLLRNHNGTGFWSEQADAVQDLGSSFKRTVDSNFHPARNGYSAMTSIIVHELGHYLHLDFDRHHWPKRDGVKYSPSFMAKLHPKSDYYDPAVPDSATFWAGPNILASGLDSDFSYFDHGPISPGSEVNTVFADTVSDCVSSYATQNIREFMAECYSEGMLADRPRPIAKLFTKALNQEPITVKEYRSAEKQWQRARAKAEDKPRYVRWRVGLDETKQPVGS